jgi:hypothetical protein
MTVLHSQVLDHDKIGLENKIKVFSISKDEEWLCVGRKEHLAVARIQSAEEVVWGADEG